jgi:hypothetical protein
MPMSDALAIAPVRGRPFPKGNPGRQSGSQNRVTRFASALLDDQAEALLQKAFEMALNGDGPMLKFLLSRILPRERTIKIHMPQLDKADDTVPVMEAIMRAIREGDISPSEGAALAVVAKENREAIDLVEAVKRLDDLQQKVRRQS